MFYRPRFKPKYLQITANLRVWKWKCTKYYMLKVQTINNSWNKYFWFFCMNYILFWYIINLKDIVYSENHVRNLFAKWTWRPDLVLFHTRSSKGSLVCLLCRGTAAGVEVDGVGILCVSSKLSSVVMIADFKQSMETFVDFPLIETMKFLTSFFSTLNEAS